jgi:hypothetical protein
MPEAAEKGMLQTEDRKWTVVRQRKNLILIVFGALSKADAEALIWAAEEKIGNGEIDFQATRKRDNNP